MNGRRLIRLVALAVLLPGPLLGQRDNTLEIRAGDAEPRAHGLAWHRGQPAVHAEVFVDTGWELRTAGSGYEAALPDGTRLRFQEELPFVEVDGQWAQLAQGPYRNGDDLYLPLQLFTDVLPDRLPQRYGAEGSRRLRLRDTSLLGAGGLSANLARARPGSGGRDPAAGNRSWATPAPADDGVRVVIIDAGHGGRDPGAMGPGRTREKDVTLGVAKALAEELRKDPTLEVHMTRDDDTLVPIWERGEIATRIRGDRPGIFLSIHANSWNVRSVRGVETYFLSEARTEHEARVAALENSAMELEQGRSGPDASELGFIISELLNLDFQRWSADLAGDIQTRLAAVHPGPDRGVKQAPLAVLTNAMMPSVLIEVGFITNPSEEETIGRAEFQRSVAEATAEAVRDFFRRYPPGASSAASR
ncbi:MAG TPA: N-acetylmuramoyl-L-alanine amidase [Longimicrobiales bacterium]|nr:N-acetylmuramoyl-L-alanine amidase [Longimicrobiales bacterium]